MSQRLGVSAEKIADLDGDIYQTSDLFTEKERALLDLTVQIGVDAPRDIPVVRGELANRYLNIHGGSHETSETRKLAVYRI